MNPKVYRFRSDKEIIQRKPHIYNEDVKEEVKAHVKKLKGISKVVVKKEIKHEDYKEVLETGKSIDKEVPSTRSIKHDVFTLKQVKTALTCYYDKFYMIDNNNCVPYGYKNV